MRLSLMASMLILAGAHGWAEGQHSAQGILLEVNSAKHQIVVSCDAMPGYMEAMVMPFSVSASEDLKAQHPETLCVSPWWRRKMRRMQNISRW